MRTMKTQVTLPMMVCLTLCGVLSVILATQATGQGQSSDLQAEINSDPNSIRLTTCRVQYIARPLLAAAESGRLIKAPHEGQMVTKDELIAETDSTMAVHQQRVAYFAYEAEKVKLESDIEMRYAEKQADVDKASYEDAADANKKVKNAVSPNMLRERFFKYEASKLRIEKVVNDMKITRAGAAVKLEEYNTAKSMVDLHQIKSPVTGVVEAPSGSRIRHAGEWVRPGDIIAMVTQTDRLRVVGLLDQHKCNRKSLKDKSVRITIPTSVDENGHVVDSRTVDSKIVHVGTEIDDQTGDIEVWAEIDNADGSITPGQFHVEMEFSTN